MRRQSSKGFLQSVGLKSTGRELMNEIIDARPKPEQGFAVANKPVVQVHDEVSPGVVTKLPPGKKTMAEIAGLSADDRLVAQCVLLEYLLAFSGTGLTRPDGTPMYLGDKVRHFSGHFSTVQVDHVTWAVSLWNRMKHTDDPNAPQPKGSDIVRATAFLGRAIVDVLRHGDVPAEQTEAVRAT